MTPKLISLDEGLKLTRRQVREHYRRFMNPGLVSLMGLLDFDKHYARAQGTVVWDVEGNEYLDFLGGFGSLNLGHNHPDVLEAMRRVQDLHSPVLLQASLNKLAAVLAHNLAQVAPGGLSRTFFCNSGTEAVEGALKLARVATGRKGFVYCDGAFHGKTLGALSVTGRPNYQKAFEPLIPHQQAIPYGDARALEAALQKESAAAFIVEPIQGEGGIIVPPPGYLREAGELCRCFGTLLVVDEIQTGFGRTGTFFACEAEDVVPDVICIAKSLGGGMMPAGAIITTEALWDKAYGGIERCTLHTSTFGGNTPAMAAGIAALEVTITQDLAGQAREKGAYLLDKLQEVAKKSSLIKEVRGRGLMIGLEFSSLDKGVLNRISMGMLDRLGKEYIASLVAGELINRFRIITAYTLNNPNVIRLEPPLVVSFEQIDKLVSALEEITGGKGAASLAFGGGKTALSSLLGRRRGG